MTTAATNKAATVQTILQQYHRASSNNCVVSGGGVVINKHKTLPWIHAKGNKNNFLFPVKPMAMVYRAKYLEGLKKMIASQLMGCKSVCN